MPEPIEREIQESLIEYLSILDCLVSYGASLELIEGWFIKMKSNHNLLSRLQESIADMRKLRIFRHISVHAIQDIEHIIIFRILQLKRWQKTVMPRMITREVTDAFDQQMGLPRDLQAVVTSYFQNHVSGPYQLPPYQPTVTAALREFGIRPTASGLVPITFVDQAVEYFGSWIPARVVSIARSIASIRCCRHNHQEPDDNLMPSGSAATAHLTASAMAEAHNRASHPATSLYL